MGSGRADMMAVGDMSYDDKGAVFLLRRTSQSDYINYMDKYQYTPSPLPTLVD